MEKISLGKIIATLIILALIFLDFYYIGLFKGTCDDSVCFNDALAKCKPVKFTRIKDNNFYEYNIYSSMFSNTCQIKITLTNVAPGSNQDIKAFLEGKSMMCEIPKTLTTRTFDDIENVLDYCHGELKEGFYQVIIKRMYSLVINDLDEVIKQVR